MIRLTPDKLQREAGRLRAGDGRWTTEDGEWKMDDGGRMTEGWRWKKKNCLK